MSGGRRGPVEGGSRAALPRARAAQHPRRPDERAQERGRQGAAQTRTQAHQNQHCGRGRQLARRTQCMARRTRRLPQGKDHGQTGSRARQGAQVVVDARTSAPRLLPARPAQPRRDAVRVLRPRHRGGRRIVAVDHEPAGGRDQRGCQAHARPPPGTVGRAYETVLRMDGVYAHGTSRPHVVRHARLLEIHRKGTGGGRRADARDRDRRATAGRRRRRLRGRVRHQERLGRTISLTHRHAIDTHDKTHFSLLNP